VAAIHVGDRRANRVALSKAKPTIVGHRQAKTRRQGAAWTYHFRG
jgi:hypothetical protein